jgi:hypothetical protein
MAEPVDPLADALREVVRCLEMEPELKTRNAAVFTAWDIASKALRGERYPWGYEPWRD